MRFSLSISLILPLLLSILSVHTAPLRHGTVVKRSSDTWSSKDVRWGYMTDEEHRLYRMDEYKDNQLRREDQESRLARLRRPTPGEPGYEEMREEERRREAAAQKKHEEEQQKQEEGKRRVEAEKKKQEEEKRRVKENLEAKRQMLEEGTRMVTEVTAQLRGYNALLDEELMRMAVMEELHKLKANREVEKG